MSDAIVNKITRKLYGEPPIAVDDRPHLLDTWHDDGTCHLCGDEWPCKPALQAEVVELRAAIVCTRYEWCGKRRCAHSSVLDAIAPGEETT